MSFSNYAENAVLNSLFGKTSSFGALASAPSLYLAVMTAAADDTSTGSALTEPAGGAYARVAVPAGDWANASNGSITLANNVEFAEATGDWGTITHFALVDAATDGNVILYGEALVSKSILAGDVLRFKAGELTVTLN